MRTRSSTTSSTPDRRVTAKVAISLPREMLRSIERLRKGTGESRSAVIRRALEMLLDRHDHTAMVREYVEGYISHPETAEELREADAIADELLLDPRL